MRGVKEVASINGNAISKHPIFQFVPEDIVTPIAYKDMPEGYRDLLHNYAMTLTDDEAGGILVYGSDRSGKTFFISQLIASLSEIAKGFGEDYYFPLALSRNDLVQITNVAPISIDDYLIYAAQALDVKPEQIVVITDHPDIAAQVRDASSPVRVILEATGAMFRVIEQQFESGTTSVWSNWEALNLTGVFFTRKDLVEVVYLSSSAKLLKNYGYRLSRAVVSEIIDHILEYADREEEQEENGVFVPIPAAVLSTILRRFVQSYKHAPSELKGNKRRQECIQEAIEWREDDLIANGVMGRSEATVLRITVPGSGEADEASGIEDLLQQLGVLPSSPEKRKATGSNAQDGTENDSEPKIVFKDFGTLESRISQRVIGQEAAVQNVVDGLAIPAAGLNDPNKPLRTMFFAGPTGVGKTQMSLTIAEELLDNPMNVIRLDMSEYSTKGSTTALFGSTPGYIGYSDEGGQLTKEVFENPNSLIILDEVEKAEPSTWDAMMQVFDAGRMTTGGGKVVDFTKTVIIMTSNLGTEKMKSRSIGFTGATTLKHNDLQSITHSSMKEYFRPEFINRIDQIVVFNNLDESSARAVVMREIDIVRERMSKRGVTLGEPEKGVLDHILQVSNFDAYGARDIQREIQKRVASPIARSILTSQSNKFSLELQTGDVAVVSG